MKVIMQKVREVFRNQKGFTLVELLVVVAIIGILATILLPRLLGYTHYSRAARVLDELRQFRQIVDAYSATNGNGAYPLASNNPADSRSVASVLASKGIKWGTSDGVRDPWGSPYMYSVAPHSPNLPDYIYSYAFVSAGPDRVFGDADDFWCTDDQPPIQQNSAGLWFVSGNYPQVRSDGK